MQSEKFTKTEQNIIYQAQKSFHKRVSITTRIRHARSVKNVEGKRELDAAFKLVKKGIFKLIPCEFPERNRDTKGYYTTFVFEIIIEEKN